MTILILAMAGDPHAKLVEDVLTQKGHSFLRYEYSWFPEKTQVGVSISKQHGIRKVLRLADKVYGWTISLRSGIVGLESRKRTILKSH